MTNTENNSKSVERASSQSSSLAVVIVNWNCEGDVIECLESIFRLEYPNVSVIVCDNGSEDQSVDLIKKWAKGDVCALSTSEPLAYLSQPPIPKPIELRVLCSEEAMDMTRHSLDRLTLLCIGENLGFAGGNNIGINFALSAESEYVWLLNADTVADPVAASALIARLKAEPEAGLCGSLLRYYDAPEILQEAGGCAYYPLIGLARRIAGDKPYETDHDWRSFERQLDYVSAASCMATRRFLTEVGTLSEDYFLYCEEIDWATRAKNRFRLALAEGSIVYHKKGISTGSKSINEGRTARSAFYLWRARRKFTKKFYPMSLPTLFATGVGIALFEICCGNRAVAKSVLRGLLGLDART